MSNWFYTPGETMNLQVSKPYNFLTYNFVCRYIFKQKSSFKVKPNFMTYELCHLIRNTLEKP